MTQLLALSTMVLSPNVIRCSLGSTGKEGLKIAWGRHNKEIHNPKVIYRGSLMTRLRRAQLPTILVICVATGGQTVGLA